MSISSSVARGCVVSVSNGPILRFLTLLGADPSFFPSRQMRKRKIAPNAYTYMGVLKALSHMRDGISAVQVRLSSPN